MRARDVIRAAAERVELNAFDCERALMGDHINIDDLRMELDKIKSILMDLGWDMDPAVETAVEVPDEWR